MTEIITDVLVAALHGEKKTRIMSKANLSYSLTCYYLAYLTRARLMMVTNEESRGTIYMTTRKGRRFLSGFKEAKSLLDAGEPETVVE